MTRLMWNAVGERLFEAGVDRGVLYVEGSEGVPWNGLVAVSESPSGGEIKPYYIDGVKYLNHAESEEFSATIEAYTYPEEFSVCDGTFSLGNGLSVTQQRKKSFGLSYRTLVGNDVSGLDLGYKIHLVYNATAVPTQRANNTLNDEIEPFNFSWEIETKPPLVAGHKPTSHFVIDSREVPNHLMLVIEDILYGAPYQPPRLPTADELVSIFRDYDMEDYIIDAGLVGDSYDDEIDGGHITTEQTSTIYGGVS